MFVFYNIQDLILLERLQLIKLVVERGVTISLSQLRLGDYSSTIYRQVNAMAEKNLVLVEEQQNDVFDFVSANTEKYNSVGRSLLALIHYCKTGDKILIVDDSELIVTDLASDFNVQTCSLVNFYKETVNDEKYLEFIIELKKDEIIA